MNTAKIIALSTLPFNAFAWNYAKAGTDWVSEFAGCGKDNQSPINLPINTKGDNFDATMSGQSMSFTVTIKDIVDNVFAGIGTPANYYQISGDGGSISLTKYDGKVMTGNFERMEIHGPSEHRFEGEQRDLEL